jgi:apolipoprotein N-acyltransferase
VPWLFLGLYAAIVVGHRGIMPLSGLAYFVTAGFLALALTAPFVLDLVAPLGSGGLGSTLIFPMAFVAVEFLRSRLAPGATWSSIAYTQYGYLPLMQVVAFAGIAGITFVIAWFASTFEMAWSRDFAWTVVRTPVLICGAVLGAILVGGGLRLAFAPSPRATIRVAAVNRPADLFVPGEMARITEGSISAAEHLYVAGKLARLHDWFLESSRREARAGARLIVWPEQNLLIFKDNEPDFLKRAQQLAASENTYLAMGMGTIHLGDKQPFENKLVLIDPSGNIILSYRKAHPAMGWEAGIMKPGDGRLPVISTRAGRIATAICYDADFPEFIRQAGQHSADILIVPANDWKQIKHLHAQMATFRAIENGVPLVRAAASGISGAFDPWGRVIGELDYFAPGDQTLTVQSPLGGVPTLYSRTGDLFAWLCVAGLVLAFGSATMNLRQLMAHASSDRLPVYCSTEEWRTLSILQIGTDTRMRRNSSFQATPRTRPGKRRGARFRLAILVLAACLLVGMGVRVAIQEAGASLNQTVQQQFIRGSQIPAGQIEEQEIADVPMRVKLQRLP